MPGQREDLVGLFDHAWDRFWRRMDGLDDEEWRWTPTADPLNASLGEAAGYLAGATGRSFVLHIADELIHHTAEAALLRDLFADASVRS
jgi:hypothetical protein